MILLQQNLCIDIIEQNNDTDGRVTHVKALVENRKLAFPSDYAPSTYDPDFLSKLTSYILNMADCELVMGADMNAVMSHDMDRLGETIQASWNNSSLVKRLKIQRRPYLL